MRILSLCLGFCIFCTGCSLAPKYVQPEPSEIANNTVWPEVVWPEGFSPDPASPGTMAAKPAPELPWQDFFLDADLQKLIGLALEHNRDLRLAALNVERTRAMYQIEQSYLLPSIAATGESSNQGISQDLSTTGQAMVSRRQTVGLGISGYELDFFGRVRNLREAALEQYLGSYEAYKTAHIALITEVAAAYLTLVADRERLAIAESTLESQRTSYEMIKKRQELGVSSELDLWQAQTSVDTARVDITKYSSQVTRDLTVLSVLTGTQLSLEQVPATNLAHLATWPELPVGLPSEVLLARPDIIQAEHVLRAADANIGAARANFFPSISLTAFAGSGTNELHNLFTGSAGMWNFIPQVNLPIFTGGRNRANLQVSETDQKIAVATYEKTIQVAFREVADFLILRNTLATQLLAQESLTHAAKQTYVLSDERYKQGIDSYLTVLDSQRFFYSSQLNLITMRMTKELNQLMLYKSLGGSVKTLASDPPKSGFLGQ